MKNKILLEEEFKDWIISTAELSENSVISYVSYLSSINKLILDLSKEHDLFYYLDIHVNNGNIDKIEKIYNDVIHYLSIKGIDNKLNLTEKTLKNYKSGLNNYYNFLIDYIDEIEIIDNSPITEEKFNIINEEDRKSEYKLTKEYSAFISRLRTQDRFYDNIFYPIRFISRIFRQHKQTKKLKKWFDNAIGAITILTKEKEILFNDVSEFKIKDGQLFAICKGNEYLAYTRLADETTPPIPFKINDLNDISLDHYNSMFNIMNDNIERLPIIVEITNELKKYIKGNTTYTKLRDISHSKKHEELNNFISTIDTNKLLDELNIISSKTKLELMDRTENTKKGKN